MAKVAAFATGNSPGRNGMAYANIFWVLYKRALLSKELPMPSLPMIQESKSPAPSPSSKFIYVVDDDPRSLAVVEDVLHAEGYLVVSFLSPQLALEVFLQTKIKPALLMTDYGMTAMNGFELIERFRRAAPDLKFILFSGQIEDFSQSEYPFKIHRFLKKPLVHSEIIKAISDAFATPVD